MQPKAPIMHNIIEAFMAKAGEYNAEFPSYFQRVELPAKTVLIEEGDISDSIFFVVNGALRAWVDRNGDDVTVQFFFEEEAVSSFMGREPSMFTVESIEPSTLIKIRIDHFERLVEALPVYKDLMIETLLRRLRHYSSLFISRIKLSPEQRYVELQERYPQLLQRVPQHYIATYLGVTSVSLSRIRNRLKR